MKVRCNCNYCGKFMYVGSGAFATHIEADGWICKRCTDEKCCFPDLYDLETGELVETE